MQLNTSQQYRLYHFIFTRYLGQEIRRWYLEQMNVMIECIEYGNQTVRVV